MGYGLPVAENLSPLETLQRMWYWARFELWPPTPLLEKKPSLLRSAQARIDYGCVLHVTAMASETVEGGVDLLVFVRSGVRKTCVHKVRVAYLGNGNADMPRCDCVNANLANNWKWCAHMLVVVFLTERVRLGFERVVYSNCAREFVEPEHKDEFLHLAELYEVKQAERILLGRLEEQAKEDGLWEGSKFEYLRDFSLRSMQLEVAPVHVQLVGPGKARKARKLREKKSDKTKTKPKKVLQFVSDDEDDAVSEQEARGAAVPKRKDRHVSNDEYQKVLALDAGQKTRKKKHN